METLLTAREVRKSLRVSEPTLWRWRRDGKLKALKLPGGGVRFRDADVLKVLRDESVPA